MRIELAWWDLREKDDPEVDALIDAVASRDLDEWNSVPNLKHKYWLQSDDGTRWGALMVWDGGKPNLSDMPENISLSLIGREPDKRLCFEVWHTSDKA